MPGPISTERTIAARGSVAPMWVRSGPGPVLPFSPNLWQARQPDWATTSLPASYCGATSMSISVGEPRGGAEVGQVGHRDDRQDAGGGRDRPALGAPLGPAVVERQQQQQDHADRRDPDRRDRDQLRRLDHAQHLEEEEEVPLGPRHVGGRGRVGLRPLLGAEHDRHHDDHGDDDQRHRRVLQHRVGEERLALLLQQLVLAEVLPPSRRGFIELGAAPLPSTPASSCGPASATFGFSALQPRRRGRAELDDEVEVGADQGDDQRPGSAACGSRRSARAWSPRTRARRAGSRLR